MKLFDLLTRILIDDSTRERFQQEGKEIKGFRGLLRVFPGHFHRLTLYNPLGLLAGVAFVASFQGFTGKENERVSIRDGEHFEDLKRKLVLRYGTNFSQRLDGHLAIVFLNGKQVSENPILNDRDEIVFAAVVGGG